MKKRSSEKFHMFIDGLRFLLSRFLPYRKYEGNYREICRSIIERCWNGRYFQTSAKGFTDFYIRDFAYCAESLCKLGYKTKVRLTLEYALSKYKKHGQIKTKISKRGTPADIFHIGPDSLALLVRSLIVTKNTDLIKKYKTFFNQEIKRYFKIIPDVQTGLVKPGYFSSVRDHTIKHSSTYDNVMLAYLKNSLDKLGLVNPFKKYDYKTKIRENFWTGRYFKNDLRSDDITGDANIFPFWLGIFKDKTMVESSLESIERAGLADPYPLRYSTKKEGRFIGLPNFFAPNYQGDTIWMQNGLIYLKLLAKIHRGKFNRYFNKYKELIERHGNFLELFTKDGQIYKTLFYKADESLIWCSILLELDGDLGETTS